MPHLYVTEYVDIAASGDPIVPPVAEQVVSFTPDTSAHESAAFNSATGFVEVISDQPCSIVFGTSPSADRTNQLLPAGVSKRVRVPAGFAISVVYNPLN